MARQSTQTPKLDFSAQHLKKLQSQVRKTISLKKNDQTSLLAILKKLKSKKVKEKIFGSNRAQGEKPGDNAAKGEPMPEAVINPFRTLQNIPSTSMSRSMLEAAGTEAGGLANAPSLAHLGGLGLIQGVNRASTEFPGREPKKAKLKKKKKKKTRQKSKRNQPKKKKIINAKVLVGHIKSRIDTKNKNKLQRNRREFAKDKKMRLGHVTKKVDTVNANKLRRRLREIGRWGVPKYALKTDPGRARKKAGPRVKLYKKKRPKKPRAVQRGAVAKKGHSAAKRRKTKKKRKGRSKAPNKSMLVPMSLTNNAQFSRLWEKERILGKKNQNQSFFFGQKFSSKALNPVSKSDIMLQESHLNSKKELTQRGLVEQTGGSSGWTGAQAQVLASLTDLTTPGNLHSPSNNAKISDFGDKSKGLVSGEGNHSGLISQSMLLPESSKEIGPN